MAIQLGTITPTKYFLGNTAVPKMFLGGLQVFSAFTPVPASFTTAGAFTYNILPDCSAIDVILIGGGGRGQNGGSGNGTMGGGAGTWAAVTLVRGVDIPLAATTIVGTVGRAGSGTTAATVTTATAAGWSGLSGAAGGAATNSVAAGASPGDLVFDGQTYVGGIGGAAGQAGASPGAGGGAGKPGNGADGAVGSAFFYAH